MAEARAEEGQRPGRRSLWLRALLAAATLVLMSIALSLSLVHWLESAILAGATTAIILLPLSALVASAAIGPALSMFRALAGTVSSYREGDFAFSLAWNRDDELGDLVAAHNALGDTLREQRLALVERELLLDTMVQQTPVAMLLCGKGERIVYANLASRKLLNGGRRMEGLALESVLSASPEPLREAVAAGGDGLFAVEGAEGDEIYYLARRTFRLNGQPHELFVLRHLTAELRRQEVRTWKKVIRVISHELNNSLAPIASLAHSGAEMLRQEQLEKLDLVFETIAARARHLETFIKGYARFAKLPIPNPERVPWEDIVAHLQAQVPFAVDGSLPKGSGLIDKAQIEQALLNLLINAAESGSESAQVQLRITERPKAVAIEVMDRGTGMSDTVLSNALLPFYSTKREGTGLGLALVREIAEAHGGRVALANREGGGLMVCIILPQ